MTEPQKAEIMKGWGVISPLSKQPFIIGKFYFSRKDAQDDISKIHARSWKTLYRKGFRAIRVEIIPLRAERERE